MVLVDYTASMDLPNPSSIVNPSKLIKILLLLTMVLFNIVKPDKLSFISNAIWSHIYFVTGIIIIL